MAVKIKGRCCSCSFSQDADPGTTILAIRGIENKGGVLFPGRVLKPELKQYYS